MRSAIILAGGKGSRLNFLNKAFLKIGDRTLIQIIIDNIEQVVNEIIVSVSDEEEKKVFEKELGNIKIVADSVKNFGPVAGILSGLKNTESDYSIVLACDMPFVNKNVVEYLFKNVKGYDAIIPKWDDDRVEPLHAVYKRDKMLIEAEKAVNSGFKRIIVPISNLSKVKYISVNEIADIDPGLKTFLNINTMEDFKRLIQNFHKFAKNNKYLNIQN